MHPRQPTSTTQTPSARLDRRRAQLASRLTGRLKRAALAPAFFVNTSLFYMARMAFACARGALGASTRRFDPRVAETWEFAAFSQNGEDGILDHLLSLVREPTRYFIEIGASDGLENNSSYLALVKRYQGLMIDGNTSKSANRRRFLQPLNWGVEHTDMMVTPERASELRDVALYPNPDLMSLDIDGMDLYVAKALLEAGLRPSVFCVEYNASFGPDAAITIPYDADFNYRTAHPSALYFGVSVAAWRALFASHGYHFVTVDVSGVNAFFVDPEAVDMSALENVVASDFRENTAHMRRERGGWETQFALIRDMQFEVVDYQP
jgi:hypothetical protein